jgi:hypothetical protein
MKYKLVDVSRQPVDGYIDNLMPPPVIFNAPKQFTCARVCINRFIKNCHECRTVASFRTSATVTRGILPPVRLAYYYYYYYYYYSTTFNHLFVTPDST